MCKDTKIVIEGQEVGHCAHFFGTSRDVHIDKESGCSHKVFRGGRIYKHPGFYGDWYEKYSSNSRIKMIDDRCEGFKMVIVFIDTS